MTATKQFSIVDGRSGKAYAVVDAVNEGQAMRRFDAVRHVVQGLPERGQFGAEPHPENVPVSVAWFKDGYFDGDRTRY